MRRAIATAKVIGVEPVEFQGRAVGDILEIRAGDGEVVVIARHGEGRLEDVVFVRPINHADVVGGRVDEQELFRRRGDNGIAVNAQDIKTSAVPDAVKQSFAKLYPNIVDVKWEMEEANYEAKFKQNKEKTDLLFDTSGKLIQTETKINSVNDLPLAVTNTLKKDFSGYEFEDTEKIKMADGKEFYKVEAELKEKEYELLFDTAGMLIKKTEEPSKEKEADHKKK